MIAHVQLFVGGSVPTTVWMDGISIVSNHRWCGYGYFVLYYIQYCYNSFSNYHIILQYVYIYIHMVLIVHLLENYCYRTVTIIQTDTTTAVSDTMQLQVMHRCGQHMHKYNELRF